MGKIAPDRIGVFDIADGAFGPSREAGNAFIAFGSDAGWPWASVTSAHADSII